MPVFELTNEGTEQFSGFSGDRNSLHMDSEFSLRGPYGKRAAHGIDVLIRGLLCEEMASNTHSGSLKKLSARFIRPAFIGQSLEVLYKNGEYELRGHKTQERITEWKVQWETENVIQLNTGIEVMHCKESECMGVWMDSKHEAVTAFSDWQLGDSRSLKVSIGLDHLKYMGEIYGVPREFIERQASLLFQLSALSSLSTLVGMVLPGRNALLAGFQLDFRGVSMGHSGYVLVAKVSRKSESAHSLTLAVEMLSEGLDQRPVFKGTVTVAMPGLGRKMIPYAEVKENMMNLGLKGRVVVITGGSRGMGEVMAKTFAAQGAKVAITFRNGKADAERVCEEIQKQGGESFAFQLDLHDHKNIQPVFQEILGKFGIVDVLINNAIESFPKIPFLETSWEDIQRAIDIVVRGAFLCAKSVLPSMVQQKSGVILQISSIAVDDPVPGQGVYVMSKSALIGLTRSLAVEFSKFGIRANTIVPSLVETSLTAHVAPVSIMAEATKTGMGRIAEPLDVAKMAVLLASDLSAFTSGQQIYVTGARPPFV